MLRLAEPETALHAHADPLAYGHAPTPFGPALLAWVPQGLCALEFCDTPAEAEAALRRLQAAWPGRKLERDGATAATWAQRVQRAMQTLPLEASAGEPALPLAIPAVSAFRQRVWQALRAIPRGEVRHYGDIARELGAPQAARAVGGAVAANPLGWVVPCHRVVRADGHVHHYRWGAARKRALLKAEGVDPLASKAPPT